MLYSRDLANFDLQPLVFTSWLADRMGDTNLRLVDTRWRGHGSGHKRYVAGHIPGAIHLDWHSDLNHTVNGIRDLLLAPNLEQSAAQGEDKNGVAEGQRNEE